MGCYPGNNCCDDCGNQPLGVLPPGGLDICTNRVVADGGRTIDSPCSILFGREICTTIDTEAWKRSCEMWVNLAGKEAKTVLQRKEADNLKAQYKDAPSEDSISGEVYAYVAIAQKASCLAMEAAHTSEAEPLPKWKPSTTPVPTLPGLPSLPGSPNAPGMPAIFPNIEQFVRDAVQAKYLPYVVVGGLAAAYFLFLDD